MHFLSNAISVVAPTRRWVLIRTLYLPVSDDCQPFMWRYDFEAVCNAPEAKSYPGNGGDPSKHGKLTGTAAQCAWVVHTDRLYS